MARKASLLVLLLLISAGAALGAYSGSYTVGPSGHFANPYVAAESIRTWGMSGNVTLNIIAGAYTLPAYINLSSVPGASSYQMTWKPRNAGDQVLISCNSSRVFYTCNTANVKIYDLTLYNSSSYAVYWDHGSARCKVEHCVIRAPLGIYEYNYLCDDDSIIRNDIKVSSSYGVYFASGYGYRVTIIGNLIYGWTIYGIYNANAYYDKILYNTIVGTGSYALYQNSCYYDTLRDNIFQAASYAWYRTYGGPLPDSCDYNCFWLNGGSSASGTIYNSSWGPMTLATWKTHGRDAKSLQYDPKTAFPFNARLKAGSPCIDSGNRPYGYPPPVAACTLDVDGTSRNYNGTPDIGAFEWAGAVALSGIYHIKNGVNRADTFPSFASSIGAVATRGVSAPVTFHVMAGIYAEGQLDFSGLTQTYRVAWQPDTTTAKVVIDASGANCAIYAAGSKRLCWKGFTIRDFVSYGFYLYPNTSVSPYVAPDTLVIANNTITGPNGIYFYSFYGGTDDSFVGNRINCTSGYYGIAASGSTSYYAYRDAFVNNMIAGFTGYGIYLNGYFYYPKLIYNTMVGMTAGSALYEANCYYDTVLNNIMSAESCALRRGGGTTYPDHSDGNCFWIANGGPTSHTINNQGSSYDLATWRTTSHNDSFSIQRDPATGAPLDPHLWPGSPCIDSARTYPPVTTDIDGDTRPYGTYCDIGADEYAGVVHDVGVVGIVAPTGTVPPGPMTPGAVVHNYDVVRGAVNATFFINSATPYQQTVQLSNGLPVGSDSTIYFTTWTATSGSYTARCSLYQAGDVNPADDTFSAVFRVSASASGWVREADVPSGPKSKYVKDGGALAYQEGTGDVFVYALKGNNRYEFYRYDMTANTWATKESIPAIGRAGRKKAVKKGAAMTAGPAGTVAGIEPSPWIVKGNSTLEFWGYVPGGTPYAWTQYADVPTGAKTIKEGSGLVGVQVADTGFVYLLKGSGTQEFYRYNITSNTWQSRASTPTGLSGKSYKNGSCLATDGFRTIWALKCSYNEFYSYDVATDVWATMTALPLIGTSNKKRKVKDGAGLAYCDGLVYGLKGDNTTEFWQYQADSSKWAQLADMPMGGGKRVRGGGALCAGEGSLYALKGNNTLEFYGYVPATADRLLLTADRPDIQIDSGLGNRNSKLSVSPNPFTNATEISCSLPGAGNVGLKLYDVTGKLVTTLASGYRSAGTSSFIVSRSSLSSGVYVLKLETGSSTTTTKLIIE